jgi:hypothetical protein
VVSTAAMVVPPAAFAADVAVLALVDTVELHDAIAIIKTPIAISVEERFCGMCRPPGVAPAERRTRRDQEPGRRCGDTDGTLVT